ncbi:MAG: T9SS type A sorting domain-containing protein [Chitinophagaceae bacterium]|nr:T9SS type A sorting domain-containing protein [Chitinophagaceae bacterium]
MTILCNLSLPLGIPTPQNLYSKETLSVPTAISAPTAVKTISNAAGVYKNGNGLFDEENELLNNLQGELSTFISVREMLQVYPNPTQRVVNIRSEIAFEHASWILHDMAGRVIAKGELLDKAFTQQIFLPVLSAGVYRLRVENASSVYMNKLIIE